MIKLTGVTREHGFLLPLITCLTGAFAVLPMLTTLLTGLETDVFTGVQGGLTLHWATTAIYDCIPSIGLSMLLAVSSLLVDLLIGVPCAYALIRLEGWPRQFIDRILILPLAVPGLTLALALVRSYDGWISFRQSIGFILCGHVLVTLPLMCAAVRSALLVNDLRPLEEAAASLSASFSRRFRDVVLPACLPGMLAGGLQVITVSLGEFNLTWLLHTPDHLTLPTMLADAYSNQRIELASAFTGLFFMLILPVLLLMQRLIARYALPMEMSS
ncbi:ABC transporter permease [Acetobacter persici]|uniref:ABC transporter permease n=1 Tax=Acetobacter persici TaxID=1076596 RepID=UPI0036DAAE86